MGFKEKLGDKLAEEIVDRLFEDLGGLLHPGTAVTIKNTTEGLTWFGIQTEHCFSQS